MGRVKRFENHSGGLKAVADRAIRRRAGWTCRLVVHPNLKGTAPRYLITNLDAATFTPEHVSDAYRLRWQVELLFKEWKSYANLHAFAASGPHYAPQRCSAIALMSPSAG